MRSGTYHIAEVLNAVKMLSKTFHLPQNAGFSDGKKCLAKIFEIPRTFRQIRRASYAIFLKILDFWLLNFEYRSKNTV